MNIRRLANGNLEMTADVNERRNIVRLRKVATCEISAEAQFISEFLSGDPMGNGISYDQVSPEDVGALTGAPLISDGENVYGYMDYQVQNFLEELIEGRTIIWQKG